MSNPYWTPEGEMLSDCCSAESCTEIINHEGMCSKCREFSPFYDSTKVLLNQNENIHKTV